MTDEPPCSTHPDAPHGFNRNASHTLGRYVCDCEGWAPINQCDGCRRGLPKSDSGIHRGSEPWDVIRCTAHLYDQQTARQKLDTLLEGRKATTFSAEDFGTPMFERSRSAEER